MAKPKLKVARAAIKLDGIVFSVPPPKRHHDVIRLIVDMGGETPVSGEQGFVLSDGSFVDRYEAYKVAKRANQLISRSGSGPKLYSEDVW